MGVGKYLGMATWLKLTKEALLTVSKVLCHTPDTKLERPKGDPLPHFNPSTLDTFTCLSPQEFPPLPALCALVSLLLLGGCHCGAPSLA